MIHSFLDKAKAFLKSKTSLIQPLIFILSFLLFSKTEITIANNSTSQIENENNNFVIYQNSQINPTNDGANGTLYEQTGGSSWYSHIFHNRRTSSGEKYHKDKYTAAHRKLPFGSIVKITNTKNGKTTFVRINDRGPYHGKRIIDLSHKTAVELGALGNPKVVIETYIPEKSFINDEEANDYFLAYSHDDKPQLLPTEDFVIINEYADFDDAVENLEDKTLYFGSLYLLAAPDQSIKRGKKSVENNDRKFYIGYRKIDILNNPIELLHLLTAK